MGGWYFEAGGHHGIMVGGEGGGHEGGAAADDEALEARELQEGRRRGGRGHAPAARGSRGREGAWTHAIRRSDFGIGPRCVKRDRMAVDEN